MPGELYGIAGYKDLAGSVANKVLQYEKRLEIRFGRTLAGESCFPSPNCTRQLASAIWDSLYAAGGASLPAGLAAGLAVLYSSGNTNPARDFEIPAGMAPQFFWECLRYFPPVYGVPYWTKRPPCAGMNSDGTFSAYKRTFFLNNTEGMAFPCPTTVADSSTGAPL